MEWFDWQNVRSSRHARIQSGQSMSMNNQSLLCWCLTAQMVEATQK
ncbi:MAG: hypothetical protein RI928_2433 [Pseudomonadota bacterium]|jgi:hypothetical protein